MDEEGRYKAIRHVLETIFTSQKILKTLAPEYGWTGMGNLLGDYGECIAMGLYGLKKADTGSNNYDAVTPEGLTVQIKANHASDHIGFRGNSDLLLVLHVDDNAEVTELYYGPFHLVKEISSNSSRDNKQMVSVRKLRRLQEEISETRKLLILQLIKLKRVHE
jgi:hypothetical protein